MIESLNLQQWHTTSTLNLKLIIPGNVVVLTSRFNTLASIPDTPDEELVREGDQILTILRRSGNSLLPSAGIEVLRAWSQRDLELTRIPALVDEFRDMQLKTLASNLAKQSDTKAVSPQTLAREYTHWGINNTSWEILVTIHTKTRKYNLAKDVLSEWEKDLDAMRKKADEIRARRTAEGSDTTTGNNTGQAPNINRILEDSIVNGIAGYKSRYYEACAQLVS